MKCIEVCPAKIFVLKPMGTKKLSDYAEKWEIRAVFKEMCNGCLECVRVCPEQAIHIEF